MQFVSNMRNVKHDAIIGDDAIPVETIVSFMNQVDRAAYVFCRWDNIGQMPKPKSVLAWVKNHWSMGDLKHEHGRQWEACCFYPMAGHKFIKRIGDVITCDRTGNNLHPTEKPEGVLLTILKANVGETILDPFAGSGTTGRAAKDIGRKAVLIDLDERYCKIAARRMTQMVLPFVD
jgi:site-specific DNA-methyltransferase (adenine-specific)